MNLNLLLDRLIPDPDDCRAAAEAMRREHPELSPLELAHRAIRSAKVRAATAGAATGAASSPITMIPAALADIAAVLKIEGTLIGVIAALLSPQTLDDPHALRADVMAVVFPAAASQVLRQVGIRAGEKLSQAAIRKYVTEDLLRTLTRLATAYMGKRLTREAIVAKAVPLVGIGIGAGWNWMEVQGIAGRAISYFSDEAIGPTPRAKLLPQMKNLWPKVSRFLPGQNKP
ncbi:MAG TPA: hypothetical protein VG326_15470 [Tepidisphaeraceae bacterium]|jgi:hypothetical protein|nr:hypothetical protein [Tepidisphaeraceae bacterium]